MTTQDQNKKTVRHFQCRDYLWDVFEQMSAELECSTDYLINEAMRQYARSRNYGTNRSAPSPSPSHIPPSYPTPRPPVARPSPSGGSAAIPSLRTGPGERSTIPVPPSPSRPIPVQPRASTSQSTPIPPPPTRRPSVPPPPAPGSRVSQSQQRVSVPPPYPGSRSPSSVSIPAAQRPPLYIIFNGQKIPVTKEEFVIGRGAKSADLAIKDGNISRRHGAIVYKNGNYFIKDLGSTNGIEFEGRHIDTKHIEEGDVVRLCDYELQFTYR